MTRLLAVAGACFLLGVACNFNDQRESPEGQGRVPESADGSAGGRPPRASDRTPATGEKKDSPGEPSPTPVGKSSSEPGPVPTGSSTDSGTATSTDQTTDPEVPAAPSFAEVEDKVLVPYCLMCHSGSTAGEAVDVSQHSLLMEAKAIVGDDNVGEPVAVVVPGDPDGSALWQTVSADRMPYFSDPLPEAAKSLLQAWIQGGALP